MESNPFIFSRGKNLENLFPTFYRGQCLDVLGDFAKELLGLLAKVFFAGPYVLLSIRSLMKLLLQTESVGYLGPS